MNNNFITEFDLNTSLSYIDGVNSTKNSNKMNDLIYGKGKIVHESNQGSIPVLGHMQYFEMAYNAHKGIYLTHENVWLTVLGEIATIVSENPEDYRKFFTDSDDKEEILVESGGSIVLAIDRITNKLKNKINVDHSLFFPEMNTFDTLYDFAAMSSFGDIVSPYYTYSMYMCGFPKIRVVGTSSDWKNIHDTIIKLSSNEVFGGTEVGQYLNKARSTVLQIIRGLESSSLTPVERTDLWNNIFAVERCGSGGQVEVTGWFKDIYHKSPSPRYTHNYPTSISKVDYTIKNIEGKFEMFTGLLSCELEVRDSGGVKFLRPRIERIVRHLEQ